MLYEFTAQIPLIYNYYALYDAIPDSEFRVEYDAPLQWTVEEQITTDGMVFPYQISIQVTNVYSDRAKSHMPDARLECSVNGVVAENKEQALNILSGYINRLCKRLTFNFNLHNCNRHLYQPRVEPDWGSAKWSKVQYQVYLDWLHEREDDAIQIPSYLYGTCSVYSTSCVKIKTQELDAQSWLQPLGEAHGFLMDEYYAALGSETVKSKFFHLFAIIEFIEHNYKQYQGTEEWFTREELERLEQSLDEVWKKNEYSFSKAQKNKLREILMSKLAEATKIGRAGKLLNILNQMGIYELKIMHESVAIDKKKLQHLIDLRNKTFHGEEDELRKYKKAVEFLLYLCEAIIQSPKL